MALFTALLEELVPAARVALPFIESMVEKGFTTTAMQSALEEAGLSFRRTDFLATVRAVKGIADTGVMLRSVRDALKPDVSRLPAPITSTLRTFSFKVGIRGIDPETGDELLSHVTISTDSLLTAGEIKAKALAMVPRVDFEVGPSSITGPLESPTAVIVSGTSRA